ncbi:hypothetical protein, partial [Photobacterium leiognathi]
SVDASVAAFGIVQNAVVSSDASNVSVEILGDIRSLTFIEANLADYQQAIEGETALVDVAALQVLINSVDTSIVALTNVQLAATNNEASGINTTTLNDIIGLTFTPANMTDYQGAIAAESSIADVAALQALIDSVDASVIAFATVQLAATSSDASTVNATLLAKIRGLTFIGSHILDYRRAIESEASIADVIALQGVIDSVDASVAAFAAVQAAATSSDASTVTVDTLTAIRNLTVDSANVTA